MLSFVTTAMNFMAVRVLASEGADDGFDWGQFFYLKNLVNALDMLLWPLLILIASIATIYAVYLGVMLAKAEDSGERDKSKAKFINVIVAMVITIAIILLLKMVVMPGLKSWLA